MITTFKAAPDIDVVTTNFPVPGLRAGPINAFVLHGAEPVLVDTGPVVQREEFMAALGSVIDPSELRWIWLTHTDFDHIGSLHQPAGRESAPHRDHHVPRCRDHRPDGTVADGTGAPAQPRPEPSRWAIAP